MSKHGTQVVTPIGTLKYVNVTGQGVPNYSGTDNLYTASIVLHVDVAQPLLKAIEAEYNANHVKGLSWQDMPWRWCDEDGNTKVDEVSYDENTAEFLLFGFKTSTTLQDGSPKTIGLADANSIVFRLQPGQRIGNGSEGAISGTAKYYSWSPKDGVSLFLHAVQVVNMVEGYGAAGRPGDVSNAGFSTYEDGFSSVEVSGDFPVPAEDDVPFDSPAPPAQAPRPAPPQGVPKRSPAAVGAAPPRMLVRR